MPIDVVDMDHVAIRVTDLEASLAFYRDLLGMPVRDRDRYEAGEVPYVAVAAGGRHLHLVPTDAESIDAAGDGPGYVPGDEASNASGDEAGSTSGDEAGSTSGDEAGNTSGTEADDDPPVGGDHVCLLLRSSEVNTRNELSALLDEIRKAGYEVEADEPKKRYGAYGRDWAAYVRDPDGRRVELKFH